MIDFVISTISRPLMLLTGKSFTTAFILPKAENIIKVNTVFGTPSVLEARSTIPTLTLVIKTRRNK
jgi:hypothetical protein